MPGYNLVIGTLRAPVDADSPIIVTADDGCYEAFLLEEDRIGLYLPETSEPLGIAYNCAEEEAEAWALAKAWGWDVEDLRK